MNHYTVNDVSAQPQDQTKEIFLVGEVSLPDVDPWILDSVWKVINDPNRVDQCTNHYGKDWEERSVLRNGTKVISAFNYGVDLGPAALEWAKTNVSRFATSVRASFSLPGFQCCGPHTDRSRDFVLIYLLQSGGHNHRTVFYQEPGQTVMRHKHIALTDYSLATPIYQIQLPLHRWVLLNTNVIHSIEDIAEGRYSLQISLDSAEDLHLESPVYHHG